MTSTPRKILPIYIQTKTGNSNIRHYQARAAAQAYSTARTVLPTWTANYFLTAETPTSPSVEESVVDTSVADRSLQDRFVAFDVLRGRDVLVKVKGCGFTIFNVCDGARELEELCGYTCNNDVIAIKIVPTLDVEAPPSAAIITKSGEFDLELSIVMLSTSPATTKIISLPTHTIPDSLITSQHYIALATPKTLQIYSPTLSLITTRPLPSPFLTGSSRWLIYPVTRSNPSLPLSAILDTPPEQPLVGRMARGLTKEVVSWGRETGERINEAIHSYLNGPTTPERKSQPIATSSSTTSSRTTLVIHDIPSNTILTQFQVPMKLGMLSLSGNMLFCSSPRGDEFFVYSLNQIPTAIHLIATFSRGYTYSSVIQVIWRHDNGCMGVISKRGTGHIFSLKRKGKETARAIGKVKIEGGVKGMMFVKRQKQRRRSSTTADSAPDVLTVANTHERVSSWKLSSATKSTIGLLTSIFNPPTKEETQSIPIARQIADYTLPSKHQNIAFPTLTSSPVIRAAFTNQHSPVDCTAKAEVECSLSTRGVTGIRGIRLFEYTTSTSNVDFGNTSPWTTRQEIDLGMPRGEVRYFPGDSRSIIETPPSSEQDSLESQPDSSSPRKRRRNRTTGGGIEKAISASLGTELDKTSMVTVPPTPPGSFSTPKVQPTEWMGDILGKGRTYVRNVRRQSTNARDEDVCFEDGVEVLSLADAPVIELDRSDSGHSDGSGHGKVRGEEW